MLGNTLNFMVNITDKGEPPISRVVYFTVNIQDTNDNSPLFENTSYTFYLQENQPSGSFVGMVIANDPDYKENGTIIYSTVRKSQFTVNETTGQITSNAVFDREMHDLYQITVQAYDNASPPKRAQFGALVTIIIIGDENDEHPTFQAEQNIFTIDTNFRPHATDYDSIPFNKIVYRLDSNSSFFSMQDNSSGNITIATSLSSEETFTLNVSAFNPSQEEYKDTITIIIVVTEVPLSAEVNYVLAGAISSAVVCVLILIVIPLVLIPYRLQEWQVPTSEQHEEHQSKMQSC